MRNSSRLPLVRLLLVGMLVPAAFSAVDYWLLSRLAENPSDEWHVGVTMAAFVVQVGLLGVLCGWLLGNKWWRWGVYLWGWLLIDLQVLSVLAFVAGSGDWSESERMLTVSLLAAQIGLAIIWGVLGTTYWAIRLPTCGVMATLFALPLIDRFSLTSELLPVGVPALVALCLVLRWRGFRLNVVEPIPDHDHGRSRNPSSVSSGSLQFGVRHVLIWTTSLAVVLGALRGLDLLSWDVLLPFLRGPIITLLTAGLLVASVFVVAMWSALGAGPAWLRWPAMFFAVALAGWVCALLSFFDHGGTLAMLRSDPTAWNYFWKYDGWMVAWMALAGGLLCASVLILRVTGYRLAQRPRMLVEGEAPAELRVLCSKQ